MKIAFLGQRGSYAEAAAAGMYADRDITTQACPTPQAVVEAVSSGSCQAGVTRLSNSEWGLNLEILGLLRSSRLHIVRDIRFHERYNLTGQRGASLDGIRRIYAHPTILSLCGDYIRNLPNVEVIARYDSAESLAELIQRGDSSEATVSGDFAAMIFGLEVLRAGIENSKDGVTRFISLAAEKQLPPDTAKSAFTGLLFEMKHRPGALMESLAAFKKNGINLTAIWARPTEGSQWDYLTYIEFIGRYEDEAVRTALAEMREQTTFMQLLGSYESIEQTVSK